MNATMGKLMEWMKWPSIVVGFAVATNGIAKFFGYERTTSEQRLEVYKAEQKGYHAARDSAQRHHADDCGPRSRSRKSK